jgi:hypothetical protein
MTGGTATAAAGEVAGQAVRTQRDDLEVPQPAERARGKAAGQPDAREAELDDRGVARDAGADTFQPTRAACRRGRTAAPTARPAAASVSSRTRCFFGACGVFLSSSSAAGPRSGRVRVQFWLHVSVSDQRERSDAPVKRRRHQPVATCCSGPTQKRDTCIGFKEHCVALDSSRGSQAKQWIHR